MKPGSAHKEYRGEAECVRIILLLADIESWLKELQKDMICSIHPPAAKLLKPGQLQLSLSALAHILERHYHSSLRHPGTGKFLISLAELLDLIKESASLPASPMPGSNHWRRQLECDHFIGINREGNSSASMILLTDARGAVITAFPG